MAHGEELRGVSDMSYPNQLPWDATRLTFCIAASVSAMILNESVHLCCWIAFTRRCGVFFGFFVKHEGSWCDAVILVTVLLSYSVHDNNPKVLIRIKIKELVFWVFLPLLSSNMSMMSLFTMGYSEECQPNMDDSCDKVTHIRTCCQFSL